MCGIAGFIDHSFSAGEQRDVMGKMLECIKHRGPEASNIYTDGPVVLGHNRLKIIDLSDEANQPFEYGGLVIIFNGEVYNYIEIRRELEALGHTFRTHGDTEVICAAYVQWGDSCVSRFIGMWALAIWDKQHNKLFCSRDRFGIKPFSYIESGKDLYFASELKALKMLPGFNKNLNIEQLNRAIQLSWSTYRHETVYANVKQLEPAHNLIWHNGKITIQRYWDVDFSKPKTTLSWKEKTEEFYTLFLDSVKLHARSDVANGTCLSGGLDSSAISSAYSTLFPNASIKSFSIFYEGKDGVDERPFVREVVNKYTNIDPYYFSPTDEQIAESFHNMAYHADVPVLGSSYISQYFLMQLAKSHGVTVVLDGQGSDEYLGGYLHSFYRIIGSKLKSGNLPSALSLLSAHTGMEGYGAGKSLNILAKSGVSAIKDENSIYNLEYSGINSLQLNGTVQPLHFETKTSDKFDNFLYHLLMNTTLQTLLHFEDKNSMAFSLESRVPFLNHKLVEFAFTLQAEDRINNQAVTKYILREGMKPILPKAVYERKDKKGFVTPGEIKWLKGPLKHLLDMDYNQFHWMDKGKLREIISAYKNGDTSKSKLVWRLVATNYWLKHFAE
jgi:asparagine synthase (glutamine-hydrolysing)